MKCLSLLALVLCSFSIHAQPLELKRVQENRFAAKTYMNAEKYDSADIAFKRFMDNKQLSIPFDYLNFAICRYKLHDTAGFLRLLDTSITMGIDTVVIKIYTRKLAGNDKEFMDGHLRINYESLRHAGWLRYDTVLINEMNAIADLDQYARLELGKQLASKKQDSNFAYLSFLQKQADSINYLRVDRLLRAGRFPGYHKCGAFLHGSAILTTFLHVSDYHEEQWQYVFHVLKVEVILGNISPDELAAIADNHYQRGSGRLCSYYGHSTSRTTELCDCKNVEKYREIIGLESLPVEYKGTNRVVPECYEPQSK